ncbi:MAG TPA: hypothetical protein VFH48_24275 [Chloroflexota bacterium]|nr:hypothetical protein [Chloroflexota bacterium]
MDDRLPLGFRVATEYAPLGSGRLPSYTVVKEDSESGYDTVWGRGGSPDQAVHNALAAIREEVILNPPPASPEPALPDDSRVLDMIRMGDARGLGVYPSTIAAELGVPGFRLGDQLADLRRRGLVEDVRFPPSNVRLTDAGRQTLAAQS